MYTLVLQPSMFVIRQNIILLCSMVCVTVLFFSVSRKPKDNYTLAKFKGGYRNHHLDGWLIG